MKLYKVNIGGYLVVLADSEGVAEDIGLKYFSEEMRNTGDAKISLTEIETVDDLPEEWTESMPWCDEQENPEELTCHEILSGSKMTTLECKECGRANYLLQCNLCQTILCGNCADNKCDCE